MEDETGAGTDEGEPVSGDVTPQVAEAGAAEAVIGPEGGTVQASAADGTVYTLEIPPGSLLAPETIRVAPVTAIDDIPLAGGFLSGAQFEPEGLVLWRPATLTVELAVAPNLAAGDVTVGYGYQGAGEAFHLDLVRRQGTTLTLPVAHFSGMGAGMAAPADIAELAQTLPGADAAYYSGQLAALLATDAAPPDYAAVMVTWFDESIAPALTAAADDEALRDAVQQYAHWAFLAEDLWVAVGWVELQQQLFAASGIDDRVAAARPLVGAALRAGFERNNAECAAPSRVWSTPRLRCAGRGSRPRSGSTTRPSCSSCPEFRQSCASSCSTAR